MQHVAALAGAGTRFTAAWSPSAWTGQSIPSVITGWYPQAIGVDDWGSQIPDSVPTLAELMGKRGYRTVLWSQHNIWRGNSSLRRGFESVHVRRGDSAVRDAVPSPSDLFDGRRPTFAFVHLLPPHGPYRPPKPFRGLLTESFGGRIEERWVDMEPDRMARAWSTKNNANGEAGAEMLRYLRARYDENGIYADHLVGQVVDAIRSAGQHDKTLMVVLADHGEGFLEHHRFFHQSSLYQELLHVPFVVKWPASVRGFAPVISQPVSLVDLVPTLVDGIAGTTGKYQGRSLLPLVFDGISPGLDVFASTRPDTRRDLSLHALRSGRFKIIYNDATSRAELYDLEADPGEQVNIARKDPMLTGALLQRLLLRRAGDRRAMSDAGGGRHNPIQEETMRALRALGYVR
jgi:arylsulfatase A-like enzyme